MEIKVHCSTISLFVLKEFQYSIIYLAICVCRLNMTYCTPYVHVVARFEAFLVSICIFIVCVCVGGGIVCFKMCV